MIEEIKIFSLAKHSGPYEAWPKTTPLRFEGIDTGKQISGYDIECQFKVGEHYLIITSYDCHFEESNSYILLDQTFNTVASAELELAYDSFLLDEYKVKNNEEIILKYHGDVFICLKIQPNKRGWFTKRISYKQCEGF